MLINQKIRQGKPSDLHEIQQLFINTVKTVCQKDYNKQQIKIWTSSTKNTKRWQEIINNQFLLVMECDGKIIGFCSLDKGNYIDMLYVHQDFQRQKVAQKLYLEIEKAAIRLNQTHLNSDVSITAKPFFEKMGFTCLAKQSIIQQGVQLTNFKMTKKLKNY